MLLTSIKANLASSPFPVGTVGELSPAVFIRIERLGQQIAGVNGLAFVYGIPIAVYLIESLIKVTNRGG